MLRARHYFFYALLLLVIQGGFLCPNALGQCSGINFKASTTKGCPLLLVKFSATGTSTSAGTAFQWNFGNGYVNGKDTISQAFNIPGQYTIKMQATLSAAVSACPVVEKDTFITVYPVPTPIIIAKPGFIDCGDAPLTFTDSTPGSTSRSWVINGKKDTSKIVKSSLGTGTYVVSLFSNNKYGCQGYTAKTEQIYSNIGTDMCDSFYAYPSYTTGSFIPEIIANPQNRKITGYSWSFPGGVPDSSKKEFPSGIEYSNLLNHYDVSLTVTADDGCSYPITRNNVVTGFLNLGFQTLCPGNFYYLFLHEMPYDFSYNLPAANFNGSSDSISYNITGNFPATVQFHLLPPPSCPVVVYYPFFVKVLGPAAQFSSDNNQICRSTDTVHLINTTDTTGAPKTNFTWYIFDSTDENLLASNYKLGPTPDFDTTYIPGKLGKFGVSLVAKSSNGCKDSINTPGFIVWAVPKSNFDSITPIACHGSKVNLVANPYPPEGYTFNYKYKWYVNSEGPAAPDSSHNPNFVYSPDSLGVYDVNLSVSNGHCLSDTFQKAAFKVIGDLTSINVASTEGCLNPTFSTIASVGHEEKYPDDPNNPPIYRWWTNKPEYVHFLDSSASSTPLIITHSGCYEIQLDIKTILDGDTCLQTYPQMGSTPPIVCVGASIDFLVQSLQLKCPGDTVYTINNSPPGVSGFKWKIIPQGLADIYPSDTARTINIVFKTDTCYSVILSGSKTINGVTCNDADTVAGLCLVVPKPDFYSTTPTLYCAPALATFKNTSILNTAVYPATYTWDFGDGESVISKDTSTVAHVYTQFRKAEYDVTLTATNDHGCTASVTKKTAINIIGPLPLFTMDKNVGCDSVTVHFTNTSKNVKKFYFLNGDDNRLDSLGLPTHQYVLNDTSLDSIIFYPTLISLDDTLCNNYFQDTIKLYRTPSGITVKNNVSVGCVPLRVQFAATSKAANGWQWDFYGDGKTEDSTHQNPVFTYTKPGIYQAKLTLTNHGQCPVTVLSNPINAAPNAVAGLVPSAKTVCGAGDIIFKNTSTGTVNFLIDYGDGSAMDSDVIVPHYYFYDPSHNTGASVSFYPKLIAFNAGGCSDTTKDTIIAYRMPVAGFTYSAVLGCSPLKVNFTDTSKYNFIAEWDFDNNGTIDSSGENVNHIYGAGLYTVKMRAITIQGCVDSVVRVNLVTVNPVPIVDFSVSDSYICYKDTVRFSNLTEPADSVVKWYWNFGDVAAPYDTGSAKNPYFIFYSPGWHTVSLAAIDNRGCEGYIRKKAVFVEDTLPPQNTKLLYVSVIDSSTIQINYNKSGIRTFEAYRVYRVANGFQATTDTVNNVNDTTYLYADTAINTSDSSYCFSIQTENQCNRVSFGSFPHCTILLTGTANPGPANFITWTGYSGWIPGWYYIYKADSGGAFKKVDSVKGNVLGWLDTALCDQTYCYYVAAKNDSSGFLSNSNSICIKAKYVHDNTPLYMYYATVLNNSVVKLQWDSSVYKNLVGYELGKYYPNKGWIDNYAFAGTNAYTDATAKVSDSSYEYRVQTIDKCGYTSPESNIATSILLKQTINNDNVALAWNSYRNWQGGVQNYLLQVQLKNNQFKTIANLPGNDTTYTDDSVYNAIDTAYCYRVMALENGNRQDSSISNLVCAVLPSRIFVPNAFTPNGDSLNDVWKVSALSVYNVIGTKVTQFDAKVYNRWGTLVFETNDINKGWDGTFNGGKAPADVYIYLISAEGIDGRYIQAKGNLTLLR